MFNFKNKKNTGEIGEDVACEYLHKQGFRIRERNVWKRVGEVDIVAQKGNTLHFVEVKTISCKQFPNEKTLEDVYDPSLNIHQEKIRKVARVSEWYVAEKEWEGEWQVDAVLVWIQEEGGVSKVEYIPQIV